MAVPHGIDRSGAAGGTGAQGMTGSLNDLTDPGADRILFWDDSAGDLEWLSLGTGLSITGTSLGISSNLQNVSSLTPTDGGFIVGDGNSFVVESGATARASLGIPNVQSPTDAGEFVIGETASNPISVPVAFSGSPMVNGKVSLSVAASALTITVLGHDGVALSASNPLFARMPQGNPLDGTYVNRKATANLTLTVSHGSTLGHANGATTPIYVYVLDNSGTLELAVSSTYYGQQSVQSTTAEGGAGGADSASTIYSTTARTSVPIVPLLKWDSAQTSAGVWLSITGEKQLAPNDRTWPKFHINLSTEQATSSGTAVDFTNIPTGTKRITVMMAGISAATNTTYAIQIGDSGGIETTGYLSSASNHTTQADGTSGFILVTTASSAVAFEGQLILSLENAANNTWIITGTYDGPGVGNIFFIGGRKALSAVLDRVRFTSLTGETLDAGNINISYE